MQLEHLKAQLPVDGLLWSPWTKHVEVLLFLPTTSSVLHPAVVVKLAKWSIFQMAVADWSKMFSFITMHPIEISTRSCV